MSEAGCRRVYLGLESGSQATLHLMNKQMTVERGRARRRPVPRGRHRGRRLLHRRLPGRDRRRRSRRPSRSRSTLPLDEISFNVPDAAAGLDAVRAPRRARRRHATGRTRTRSPSSIRSEIDESWLRRRIDETMSGVRGEGLSRRSRRPAPLRRRRRAARRASAQPPEERFRRRPRTAGAAAGAVAPEPPPQHELRRGPRGWRSASWRPRSRRRRSAPGSSAGCSCGRHSRVTRPSIRSPQGRARQRVGHREAEVVERQRARRSAASRARCRRSRRGSRG